MAACHEFWEVVELSHNLHVFGDTYFYNRVGVAIFVVTAHGKYMIGGVGEVGWGGIIASM